MQTQYSLRDLLGCLPGAPNGTVVSRGSKRGNKTTRPEMRRDRRQADEVHFRGEKRWAVEDRDKESGQTPSFRVGIGQTKV